MQLLHRLAREVWLRVESVKDRLNQAVQRVDTVGFDQITTVGLPPRVEKLVRCKKGSSFVVDTIADHAKRVLFEQFRNVSTVTDGELFEGVVNRRFFLDRTFEFEYDQRQTVDLQNAVGDAFFAANNFQLIDQFESILIGSVVAQFFSHNCGIVFQPVVILNDAARMTGWKPIPR